MPSEERYRQMTTIGDVRTGIVIVEASSTESEIADVVAAVSRLQPGARVARGDDWIAIPLGAGIRPIDVDRIEALRSVDRVTLVDAPYPLVSREAFSDDVCVRLGAAGSAIGVGGESPIVLMVGSSWALASEGRLRVLAPLLSEAGCTVLHSGPFAGAESLARVRAVADEHGFALSVEVTDGRELSAAEPLADLLQVASPSMQDFGLLRDLGRADCPVILKRGAGATVEEFLLAAEYVLTHGNGRVILCESGIRTFDSARRARFEINAIPLIKRCTHLPLLADPAASTSHGRLIPGVARAAIAAGADGLVLEVGTDSVHDPDGTAIDVVTLRRLMTELRPVARAVGRSMDRGAANGDRRVPEDAGELLRITDRTLGVLIESIVDVAPSLEVLSQWRLSPPITPWLARQLSSDSEILGRCTSYRLGGVRLSRNIAYVDLTRIDPTIAVLLETEQLNLGQLFLDPRIEKRSFEFGTDRDAGEIDVVLRSCFPEEAGDLDPYVWRRYEGVIDGAVVFVVIESLPAHTWARLLDSDYGPAMPQRSVV